MDTEEKQARRSRWISEPLDALQAEADNDRHVAFDVVIVGSGYGGSVAADRLGRCSSDTGKLRIAVLERGLEYLPGSFPTGMSTLAGHVRFSAEDTGGPRGLREGLFDFRLGKDMSVLVANGVGGGSLINAGVLESPLESVLQQPEWPGNAWRDLLARMKTLRTGELGSVSCKSSSSSPDDIARRRAWQDLGGESYKPAQVSIALEPTVTVGGVSLSACANCGDCFTGCNQAAKNSLDVNLLARARSNGIRIFSGATVTELRRAGTAWEIDVWHTDLTRRRRMAKPLQVRAARLILAAGTLGSTELLLRSRKDESLRFSSALGSRFSGNGDILAAISGSDRRMNAVVDETTSPRDRRVGPTITSIVDRREVDGLVVEDMATPGALRRLVEEVVTTADVLHDLDRADTQSHGPDVEGVDPCAVNSERIDRSTVIAIISHDSSGGRIECVESQGTDLDVDLPQEASIRIAWEAARSDPRIEQAMSTVEKRMAETIGGRLVANPLWRAMPPALEKMLEVGRGPLVTVHPLGGCPMGMSRHDGVVDDLGRVYDAKEDDPRAVHDGLVVLDGSIIPTSLGINPALTIAAVADRAIHALIGEWGWTIEKPSAIPSRERPVRSHSPERPKGAPTKVEVLERLTGWIEVGGRRRWAELSLVYEPFDLVSIDFPRSGRRIDVRPDPTLSNLRIFESHQSAFNTDAKKDIPLLEAPVVDGELRFFHRHATDVWSRTPRAVLAWFVNRGARDIWQACSGDSPQTSFTSMLVGVLRLATHAGELRRFDYEIKLGQASIASHEFALWNQTLEPRRLAGNKRIGYGRRASPWRQLMTLNIEKIGELQLGRLSRLTVDPVYFARMQTPLMRVLQKENEPQALADLASFLLHVARILVNGQMWTFRKPDLAIVERRPVRLPGAIAGLPEPEILWTTQAPPRARLARYRAARSEGPPVLMIHGYSANGMTFAHPEVRPNLVTYLWERGIEPWVLDLRTSSGLDTCKDPWSFEDVASEDIPRAVELAIEQTGKERIDVITHCMGSAMFSLALLSGAHPAITRQVRRWVMSQVGPWVRFSPANILRTYVIRYVLNVFPGLSYSFNDPRTAAGDMFDRFLAGMPYLEDERGSEFDIENPFPRFWRRTPWVRTRHRLDALFGRTFDARRMAPAVLDHIDDFFGPINLQTASQPIFFARHGRVTDRFGRFPWQEADLRPRLADIEILSLHSRDNGLADWATRDQLLEVMRRNGIKFQAEQVFENQGHQDLLIGADASRAFARIHQFLS